MGDIEKAIEQSNNARSIVLLDSIKYNAKTMERVKDWLELAGSMVVSRCPDIDGCIADLWAAHEKAIQIEKDIRNTMEFLHTRWRDLNG